MKDDLEIFRPKGWEMLNYECFPALEEIQLNYKKVVLEGKI
jgi:hypothetical protein